MKHWRVGRAGAIGAALVLVITTVGCGHKLVAYGKEKQVRVFRSEDTYKKLKEMQNKPGLMAMVGGAGEEMLSTPVDPGTPVRIIKRSPEGAEIEVTDGPHKGLKGFVAKSNLD